MGESFSCFRKLDRAFCLALKEGCLRHILDFEKEYRDSFMIEIRNNYLDLYFLGHAIEVRRKGENYYLIADNKFNPKDSLAEDLRPIVKNHRMNKWKLAFCDINNYDVFREITESVIAKIVLHKKGAISEGVSEINHFVDNRAKESLINTV